MKRVIALEAVVIDDINRFRNSRTARYSHTGMWSLLLSFFRGSLLSAYTTITKLLDSECDAWDAFVHDSPQGTFFHKAGWRTVLEKAFGHRAHYLTSRDAQGCINGILPLIHMKSRLFGSSLVSVPFCVEGGVLAANVDIEVALLNEATKLAQHLAVDYLELRNRLPSSMNWPAKDLYVSFRKEISSDNEVNMSSIPRKQRAMVRGGLKNALESVESDDWSRLYGVYSESVRNLGTPVFSRRYFRLLCEEFGQDCRILMVTHDGQDIAGVMSFYFRDEVLPYYGGSKSIARAVKANDFMYWELMRRSAEQGVRIFDFGRSKKGTGSFSFKKNWGFTPEQLHYEYKLVNSTSIPELNPTNPRYAWAIDKWKKLPLPVANTLGPLLSRTLG